MLQLTQRNKGAISSGTRRFVQAVQPVAALCERPVIDFVPNTVRIPLEEIPRAGEWILFYACIIHPRFHRGNEQSFPKRPLCTHGKTAEDFLKRSSLDLVQVRLRCNFVAMMRQIRFTCSVYSHPRVI